MQLSICPHRQHPFFSITFNNRVHKRSKDSADDENLPLPATGNPEALHQRNKNRKLGTRISTFRACLPFSFSSDESANDSRQLSRREKKRSLLSKMILSYSEDGSGYSEGKYSSSSLEQSDEDTSTRRGGRIFHLLDKMCVPPAPTKVQERPALLSCTQDKYYIPSE